MIKPIIITCQPIDEYFIWQNHLYIESCIEAGFDEERIHILLYLPPGRDANTEKWNKLKEYYPKLNIFVYEDKGVAPYLGVYIPILRPHILSQHFEAFPELEKEVILYTDCDILWTEKLDIKKYFEDDVCYISDASSYLNADYFDAKHTQVLEDKKELSSSRDFLQEICSIVGIDKSITREHNNNTGGVQYLLKNVNAAFWKKVENDTLYIRQHLLNVNKEFYSSENAGIQSWCADLWAVQYNLWFFNKETKVVPEMTFAWSSDGIDRIKETGILHNAGITDKFMGGQYPAFYKGAYHTGISPFSDRHLYTVLMDEKSKKQCTHYYAQKLAQLKDKYNLI